MWDATGRHGQHEADPSYIVCTVRWSLALDHLELLSRASTAFQLVDDVEAPIVVFGDTDLGTSSQPIIRTANGYRPDLDHDAGAVLTRSHLQQSMLQLERYETLLSSSHYSLRDVWPIEVAVSRLPRPFQRWCRDSDSLLGHFAALDALITIKPPSVDHEGLVSQLRRKIPVTALVTWSGWQMA